MKTGTPFIRGLSLCLAWFMLRASLCAAAGLVPGSIALLDGPPGGPEVGAAWEQAAREANLDPGLLVRGKEETALILDRWREEGKVLLDVWKTADSAAIQEVGRLMEEAWSAYYTFHFERALAHLDKAGELLAAPGDSNFRSRVSFDSGILRGMILRAQGDRAFSGEFMNAAALDPQAVLAPDRYSPEIIADYTRARKSLLAKGTLSLSVKGTPADAEVFLDGKKAGTALGTEVSLYPGVHFIEARAPGYEPWSTRLLVREWDHPSLDFALRKVGPEGEHSRFFLERLAAGDSSYLSDLAGRLEVDYVLIPDGREGILRCRLVGARGLFLGQAVLWSGGEGQEAAGPRMADFLAPLRFRLDLAGESSLAQVNLPTDTEFSPEAEEIRNVPAWKRYGPVILVLLVLGVAAGSGGDGGGTSVEVAW